jgi:hypothetical protein
LTHGYVGADRALNLAVTMCWVQSNAVLFSAVTNRGWLFCASPAPSWIYTQLLKIPSDFILRNWTFLWIQNVSLAMWFFFWFSGNSSVLNIIESFNFLTRGDRVSSCISLIIIDAFHTLCLLQNHRIKAPFSRIRPNTQKNSAKIIYFCWNRQDKSIMSVPLGQHCPCSVALCLLGGGGPTPTGKKWRVMNRGK